MRTTLANLPSAVELPEFVDFLRLDASRRLQTDRRSELGQFFTPMGVARMMARLASVRGQHIRLLDPGAGVGSLTAAWLAAVLTGARKPNSIEVTAYEVDSTLVAELSQVLDLCREVSSRAGVDFRYDLRNRDFVRDSVASLGRGLFAVPPDEYDCVIMNPPYRKIGSNSPERLLLRELGVETGNLYSAFVSLAVSLLRRGGEAIAITPRSFCNGPYFSPFRKQLLGKSSLTHLYVFDARDAAFGEDEVLQENVVFRVVRGVTQAESVEIGWSETGDADKVECRSVSFREVVHSGDPDQFIHIAPDEWDTQVASLVRGLGGSLSSLGIDVSTGRVVDFRAAAFLVELPSEGAVPLIYPGHLSGASVVWPRVPFKKPNAILQTSQTQSLLVPAGTYVLVKRFSAKEERRRVTAAIYAEKTIDAEWVGFENHLNYFHCCGTGLPRELAVGLCAYLNSTLVDSFFRQFNGHTQVNATDLRKLPYPTAQQLENIGRAVGDMTLLQGELDRMVEEELVSVTESEATNGADRIAEALEVLKTLGVPKGQQGERSALTLLALLNLKPQEAWGEASNPLRGVTPIMDFAAAHYGKNYAPNTRETVRRLTLHQFEDAGIVIANPDMPGRAINSPAYCYQVPQRLLETLRTFGSNDWDRAVRDYLAEAGTLREKYAQVREMQRIPVQVRDGVEVRLSPGGHNELIARIIGEFCERFTPGAVLLYVGDTGDKLAYVDEEWLRRLGITIDQHGKMPDVVVYFPERNWLVLVEAVTSHGPVDAKRRIELAALFAGAPAPVYVTAFMDRQGLNKYLGAIAWETEVWVAESPEHLIHFNGERFLGPYEQG